MTPPHARGGMSGITMNAVAFDDPMIHDLARFGRRQVNHPARPGNAATAEGVATTGAGSAGGWAPGWWMVVSNTGSIARWITRVCRRCKLAG